MKYFLRRMPLEFYYILLPSVFLILSYWGNRLIQVDTNIYKTNNSTYLEAIIFYPIIIFVIYKFIIFLIKNIFDNQTTINKFSNGTQALISLLFIITCSFLSIFTVALVSSAIFRNSNVSNVIIVSQKIMQADLNIFHTYPPFYIQKIISSSKILEFLVINSYLFLFLFFKLFLIFTFFKIQIFRKFMLTFFLGFLIAFPFWQFWPVMYPSAMYRLNVFDIQIPSKIQSYINNNMPTDSTIDKINEIDNYWISPESKYLSVSANPSMHVAWGLIFVWFTYQLSSYLLFFSVPWFIFESIGTLYLLQHYAIDIITGIFVGLLSVIIVEVSMRFERRYFIDDFKLFSFFDFIHRIILG